MSQAAALFDWDGTLLDSRAALLRAWHEATVHVLGRRFPDTPGVSEMLQALRDRGLATAVITSKARRRYAPDARRSGLDALVDVAVCAEDVAASKPDPAPVLRALEELGVPASRAVMAGDTPVDVLAGLRAGTMVIGVSWGHFGEQELRAAGAAAVAGHPEELVELVMNTMREGVGT